MLKENFEMKKGEEKFVVPESELEFSFSRSGGAGGQNVNKVETKVTVRWNFNDSLSLDENQKRLIAEKLRSRINEAGEVIIYSQTERSQAQNKEKAIQILNELVNSALAVPAERKETKVPKREKEKRLKEKRRQAEKKQLRKDVGY